MSDLAELLERFRRGPEFVAMILTGAAGEEVDFIFEPGKWSIRQIIRHLADSEMVGAMRLRQVAAEENPTIVWCDEKAWAEKLDYATRKPAQSLELFRKVRADNYEFIKDVSAGTWDRVGTHSKDGTQTFRQYVEIDADHAESHARQMQTVRAAWKAHKQSLAAVARETPKI